MKKKLFIIGLILLFLAGAAYARMAVVGIAGMVAREGGTCSVSNETALFTPATGGSVLAGNWACTQATFSGTSTVTSFEINTRIWSGSGSTTVQLYLDNEGLPGDAIAGSSATYSTDSETVVTVDAVLDTPKTGVSSPVWACMQQSDGATYSYRSQYAAREGGKITYGTTRTSGATANYDFAIKVLGCVE